MFHPEQSRSVRGCREKLRFSAFELLKRHKRLHVYNQSVIGSRIRSFDCYWNKWPSLTVKGRCALYCVIHVYYGVQHTLRWWKSASAFISLTRCSFRTFRDKTKIVVCLYVHLIAFHFQLILMTFNNVEWTFDVNYGFAIRTGIFSSARML